MQRISSEALRSFIEAILSLVAEQRLKTLNNQVSILVIYILSNYYS